MSKISREEFLRNVIKKESLIIRIFLFLHITNFKVIDKRVWNNNNDYYVSIRQLNPYNPLAWIVFIVLLPLSVLQYGVVNHTKKDFKRIFRYE